MEILDLTIVSEITEDGPWWSGSLYWSPDTDDLEDEADPAAVAIETRTG